MSPAQAASRYSAAYTPYATYFLSMPYLLYFTLLYLLANLGKAKAPGSPQSFRGMKYGAPNSSGGTPSTHLFTLRRGTAHLFFQLLYCPATGSRRFPGAAARGGGRASPSYSTSQTRLSTLLRYPNYTSCM